MNGREIVLLKSIFGNLINFRVAQKGVPYSNLPETATVETNLLIGLLLLASPSGSRISDSALAPQAHPATSQLSQCVDV